MKDFRIAGSDVEGGDRLTVAYLTREGRIGAWWIVTFGPALNEAERWTAVAIAGTRWGATRLARKWLRRMA